MKTVNNELGLDKKPDPKFKRFFLVRKEDVSGVSGIGYVAEGVQFSSGECVIHWTSTIPSITIFRSYAELLAIHGHSGTTEILWCDNENNSECSTTINKVKTNKK